MVLSDRAIRAALERGDIVCDPAPKKIESTSIDVRLGEHFWFPRRDQNRTFVVDVRGDSHDHWEYVHAPESIIIPPQTKVLGHTIEFIGSNVGTIVPHMRCRSTINRWGVSVCQCAGWGDAGYTSRWTMEIKNDLDYPVLIPIGAYVAQIIFERVEGEGRLYTKHYNAGPNVWTPEHMLPKAIHDER